MAAETARVVVVGLGAMGSAACYHLARRGVEVVGFDAFDVPHSRGSSHGESRIIRACYFEHSDYVPLLGRAFDLWHELARDSGRPVIGITGGLFIGPPESPLVSGSRRAGETHRIAHEYLTGGELGRRFPQFALGRTVAAVYEPGAGFVRPELAVAAHLDLARRWGARLYTGEPVVEWHAADAGTVSVKTRARSVEAAALILCAGAWTARLVPALAARLTVTRQTMVWVAEADRQLFSPRVFPVWAMQHDAGDFHYGFPLIDPARGLKLGRHVPGPAVDPECIDRLPREADGHEARSFLQRYLPRGDGEIREVSVCMYTNSADGHFIIGRHPDHAQVHVACGFSGHGFKFAPVVGEALADLALAGSTALPVDFLDGARFH